MNQLDEVKNIQGMKTMTSFTRRSLSGESICPDLKDTAAPKVGQSDVVLDLFTETHVFCI